MRDTWLVKNYGHILRRGAPTTRDTVAVFPFVWIDILTDTAYITQSAGVWIEKAPDKIIVTPSNSIFVIETIAAAKKILVLQGSAITIQGKGILI